MRDLPGESTFIPWDAALPEQTATQFFTIDSGPGGGPCPRRRGRSIPAFERPRRATPPALHAPFTLDVNRADGDQNLTGARRHDPARVLRDAEGVPYCPDAAIARSPAAGTAAGPSRPPPPVRRPARSAVAAPAPAPAPARSTSRQGLPRRSIQRGAAQPRGRHPGGLRPLRPRQRRRPRRRSQVDPVTAQVTAVSDPLPQILDGIPLRTALVQVNLDRPDFALNPTNCDPFAVGTELFGDEGGERPRADPIPGRELPRLPSGPEARHQADRRRQPPRPPGDPRHPDGRAGRSEHQSRVDPCRRASCSTTATSAPSAPARSSPPTPARPSSLIGTAEAVTPLLDQPLERQRLPALLEPQAARPRRSTSRARSTSNWPARIDTVNGGALRTSFEASPTCRSRASSSTCSAAPRACCRTARASAASRSGPTVKMTGQNGAVVNSKPKLQTTCGGKARQKRAAKHEKGRG